MKIVQSRKKPTQSPAALGLIEYRRLCDLLAVSRPTLDKLAETPAFPQRIKLGKVFYVRINDVQRWIDRRFSCPRRAA